MSLKDMHLLVVDDDKYVRDTLKDLLELEDATVTLASDGKEAFELVCKDGAPYDLILSDIRMPNCTGIEFLEKIRFYDGKVADVILISAFTDITPLEAANLGAKGIFTKQNVIDRLLEYVRKKKSEKEELPPVNDDILADDGPFNVLKYSID